MLSENNFQDGTQLPIFVYGTLRSGQPNYWLLRGRTLAEIPATISGMIMVSLGDYPAILESEVYDFPALANQNAPYDQDYRESEQIIHGQLITLHPQFYTDTLALLDQLEGYRPGDKTSLYWRRMVCARSQTNHEFSAWAYIGNSALISPMEGRHIPHGDWYRYRSDLMRDLKFARYILDKPASRLDGTQQQLEIHKHLSKDLLETD